MTDPQLTVYLSGEIHTPWRDEIAELIQERSLAIQLLSPVTDHASSDDCGVNILGQEDQTFWHDHKGAKVNAIRTRTFMKRADVVVVKFGEKYRQWNAAFDAGIAAAFNKPLIVIHPEAFNHALKEIDAASLAVCDNHQQVVSILDYVLTSRL